MLRACWFHGRHAAAALTTAIPLGIWMGLPPVARSLFDPLVECYRPVPPLAYLPHPRVMHRATILGDKPYRASRGPAPAPGASARGQAG